MPDLVILTGDSEVNLAPGAEVTLAAGSEVTLANQPITATVTGTVTANLAASSEIIMQGVNDAGTATNVAMTGEGHMEVAIHSPIGPFGSVHTESQYPIFQLDGVYGLNSQLMRLTTSGTGADASANSLLTVQTGTTVSSFATMQSRKRLRYRAGQGSIAKFTAMFSTPVASSILVAGLGHAEDGVYIGYNGTSFGILYSRYGVREIQTLTITTRSTTAENVTVTLGGTPFSVPVTVAASTGQTAYEIARYASYTGWQAYANGSTVVFLANSSGNQAGTFSVSGTTIVGTFAETRAGAANTETWIPQASWNGDKLDGTGASGITINPQNLNVFLINVQYLGAGAIEFQAEVSPANSNNPVFTTIHTLRLPNTLTRSSFGNPSFPFTLAAYSVGSTTNVSVSSASMFGGIEGDKVLQGPRVSYTNTSTTVADGGNHYHLLSILNPYVYKGKANQSVINLISFSGSARHTQPVTFHIMRNATINGDVTWSQYSTGGQSVGIWTNANAATNTVTITDNIQQVVTAQIGVDGDFIIPFADDITVQPGEIISLVAQTRSGTAAFVSGTINTREDQ